MKLKVFIDQFQDELKIEVKNIHIINADTNEEIDFPQFSELSINYEDRSKDSILFKVPIKFKQ